MSGVGGAHGCGVDGCMSAVLRVGGGGERWCGWVVRDWIGGGMAVLY